MNVSSPFIQSAYSWIVRTSASGSACAEKLALGVQYVWHTSQPLPASQASKNCLATAVMVGMASSLLATFPEPTVPLRTVDRPSARDTASRSVAILHEFGLAVQHSAVGGRGG